MEPFTASRTGVFYALAYIIFCATAATSTSEADNMDRRLPEAIKLALDGKELDSHRVRRASSFVRIGKSILPSPGADMFAEDSLAGADDYASELTGNDEFDTAKRASSFVRIGKSILNEQDLSSNEMEDNLLKRASSFVRIGRSHPSSLSVASLVSSLPRKSDDLSRKRMSSFVRIGKRRPYMPAAASAVLDEEPKTQAVWSSGRGIEAVRVDRPIASDRSRSNSGCATASGTSALCKSAGNIDGASLAAGPDKKASSFIRIGRSVADE